MPQAPSDGTPPPDAQVVLDQITEVDCTSQGACSVDCSGVNACNNGVDCPTGCSNCGPSDSCLNC